LRLCCDDQLGVCESLFLVSKLDRSRGVLIIMAEAVGIVLAIAPLVISAYEHYGETAQCIKRYRDYTRSVKRLAKSLNIQGTIFRTANARLLAHCVDKDHARLMLDDRAHPSWKDPQIAAAYLARLADSRDAFVDSIDLIIEHLTGLQSKIEDFQKLCDQSPKVRYSRCCRMIMLTRSGLSRAKAVLCARLARKSNSPSQSLMLLNFSSS